MPSHLLVLWTENELTGPPLICMEQTLVKCMKGAMEKLRGQKYTVPTLLSHRLERVTDKEINKKKNINKEIKIKAAKFFID